MEKEHVNHWINTHVTRTTDTTFILGKTIYKAYELTHEDTKRIGYQLFLKCLKSHPITQEHKYIMGQGRGFLNIRLK